MPKRVLAQGEPCAALPRPVGQSPAVGQRCQGSCHSRQGWWQGDGPAAALWSAFGLVASTKSRLRNPHTPTCPPERGFQHYTSRKSRRNENTKTKILLL